MRDRQPESWYVISGLESRNNSVKRNNERKEVIMFILCLLVNRCSVHVKQKSKAKIMAKKAHIIQCMFYLYSASAAEGGPPLTIIYCGVVWVNARYKLYRYINCADIKIAFIFPHSVVKSNYLNKKNVLCFMIFMSSTFLVLID